MSDELDVTNLAPGTVLMGKYRVVRTLGVGGMGVVIACDHLQLDTRVAIKFLLPNLIGTQSVVQRFMQEARAATRIRSAHVARVIDVGRLTDPSLPDEGVPYMVMEYLDGKDLSEWIRMGKKFPVSDAIDFTVQACEALAQAHKQGIIHRDIKPANLFLASKDDGKLIKVLDFGISKIMEEEPQEMGLTKTTTVLGSGLYMSPEQMRSAKSVDFRTDIYSVGVCLFELLTGTQPHTAETFSELCVKVNIDPPTPLRDYRPDISDDLAEVIAKAYAKDPDDRYQSVHELATALAPYANAEVVPVIQKIQSITRHGSMPPPPPAVARTSAGVTATAQPVDVKPKSGATMVLTAAVVTLALAAVAGGILIRTRVDEAADPAPALSNEATEEVTRSAPPVPSASAIDLDDVDIGTETVSSAAVPSASVVAKPAPVPRPKAEPKPEPPPPPVVPKPPPCVPKKDESGMIIPCL